MENITIKKAKEMLKEMGNDIFSVEFIKKNGELRKMLCRLHVKKHLKGGKMSYNPLDKGLLPVYDLQKEAYRMINMNTLKKIKHKDEYFIKEG